MVIPLARTWNGKSSTKYAVLDLLRQSEHTDSVMLTVSQGGECHVVSWTKQKYETMEPAMRTKSNGSSDFEVLTRALLEQRPFRECMNTLH